MTKIDAERKDYTLQTLLSEISSGNESVLIQQGDKIIAELVPGGERTFSASHSVNEEISAEIYSYKTEGETLAVRR